MQLRRTFRSGLFALTLALGTMSASCGNGTGGGGTVTQAQVTAEVKAAITADLAELVSAARAIQAAAPAPDADGWNATADAAAVNTMRTEWKRARLAYERIEGAIAVLFPELDASTDERYDGFISEGPDMNLFDGMGVTGVHGIERILWANEVPANVAMFEMGLPNNPTPAAFPATMQQASDFRTGLAQKLIDDCVRMQTEFMGVTLDNAAAFRGVIASMGEQVEKVRLGASAEEESRYARHTLADMRANLAGGVRTFNSFKPLLVQGGHSMLVTQIEAKFAEISATYTRLTGDSIPAVPAGWNPDAPTAEQLATPYGQLYTQLNNEADPMRAGSLVSLMNQAATALMIPELPE